MPRPAPGDRSHLQKKILNTGYPEIDGDKFNPSDYILDQLTFRGEISDLMQRMFVPPLIMSGLALSNSVNDLLVSNGAVFAEIPYDTVIPHNNTGAALTSLPQTGVLGIANGVSLILNIPSSGAIGDNSTLNTVRAKVVWLDGELRNRQSNPLSTYSYVRKARLEIAVNPGVPANYPIQLGQFQCTIVGPNVTTFNVVAGARSEDFHFQFEKAPTSEADAVTNNELMRLGQFLAIFSAAISDAPVWNETLTAPSARAANDRFVDNVSNESIAGVKTLTNTTESTNKDTGGLITEGGLGVEKRINAGGRIASGTTVEGNLPPAANNDLTRKDWIEQRATHSRRQTVAAGRVGAVHADFIEPTTGLAVAAKADSTNPIITTIAAGFHSDGAPKDFVNRTEADKTFSGLTANASNFLGLKRISATQVDPVTALLPPVYAQVFSSDRENKINASFNGTNGDTEFIDPYGNFFRCYGPGWQLSNINQYSGMNTLRCEGVDNVASTNRCELILANLDARNLDQWTVECFFRLDASAGANHRPVFSLLAGPTDYHGAFVHLHPTDGTPHFYLSTDESGYNIWNNSPVIPMNAVASRAGFGNLATGGIGMPLQASQWYHIAWVFDGLSHRVFINGYLVIAYNAQSGYNAIFNELKIPAIRKILLGAKFDSSNAEKMLGNISNFAFHPYAKYQTKKYPTASDTPAVRDIFTPPSVPLSLTTQTDRAFNEAEAIYLDFESAADGDVITKDLYGRQLTCFGNDNATLTRGCYIESGAAKFGTKSLYFSGANANVNAAHIKAPVWADKWTVEFWAKKNNLTGSGFPFSLVVPPVGAANGFGITFLGNGTNNSISVRLGTSDASADIMSYDSPYSYAMDYIHIAVSYDGIAYRVFIGGNLLNTVVSRLKVVNGSYFCFGRAADNSNHLNGAIDDFAYVSYCKYITNFTPPVTALLSAMPVQYLFDTKKMQMYKGYPTAFAAENTVFIGEALTSALNVEKAITYALNGEYYERFSSDFVGTSLAYLIIRRSNIGVNKVKYKGMLAYTHLSGNVAKGSIVDLFTVYDNGSYRQTMPVLGSHDRNNYSMYFALFSGEPSVAVAGSGVISILTRSSAQFTYDILVEIERSF